MGMPASMQSSAAGVLVGSPAGAGAGAAARQVVGIGVIGGMITAVFIGVFFIPSFFYLIAKLAKLDKKAALERQEKAS